MLVALEIAARVVGFQPQTWSTLDPDLGYRMVRPSTHWPVPEADIVLLGDSITYVLRKIATFSALLSDAGYGVVNLSGIGYGTDQEYLLLTRHLQDLPPVEWVVLNFCLFNDFIDNGNSVNPHDGFRPKPYFSVDGGRLEAHQDHLRVDPVRKTLYFVNQRWTGHYLLRLGLSKLGLLPDASRDPKHFTFRPLLPLTREENYAIYQLSVVRAFDVTRALLERLRSVAEAELGAGFLVLLHPTAAVPEGRSPFEPAPPIRDFFGSLDMPVYDLGCHYEARQLNFEDIAIDPIGHLTQLGHTEVADVVESFVTGIGVRRECLLADGASASTRTASSR